MATGEGNRTVFNIAQTGVALRDDTTQVAYEDIGGLKEEIQIDVCISTCSSYVSMTLQKFEFNFSLKNFYKR